MGHFAVALLAPNKYMKYILKINYQLEIDVIKYFDNQL